MKGNLLQGTARGSLGDTVFYRSRGEQMARVRVRQISNPRSFPQLLNRVILATAGRAYALFKDITDHSFQNFNGPRANQSEFMRRNVKLLQDQFDQFVRNGSFRVAYNVDGSFSILVDETQNFNGKSDLYAVFNPYQISAGTLPPVAFTPYIASDGRFGVDLLGLPALPVDVADLPSWTWRRFAEALGVPVGSQLTFVFGYSTVGDSETLSNASIYRIILSDSDGRTDTPMFDTSVSGMVGLLNPNGQNIGTITWPVTDEIIMVHCDIDTLPEGVQFLAGTVIVSQLSGTSWMRSNAFLQSIDTATGVYRLGGAVTSYLTSTDSAALLNQARQGLPLGSE